MESPFVLQAWYELHRESCCKCERFGDWAYAHAHNAENPCYIADILAMLHHGYLIPFQTLPRPFDKGENYDSISQAPAAVAKEWAKMADNRVVFRVSATGIQPACVAPLMAVIKQSDLEDAYAELTARGWSQPVEECDAEVQGAPGEEYVALADAEASVDALNRALEACGADMRVKARLCADNSVTTNRHTIPLPFSFPPVDQLLEDLPIGGWLCKIDYRRCFFNIPLHREMYKYMGLRAPDGSLWVSHRVLFGITTGPHIASILTAETARFMRSRGVPVQVYIDDNAIAAASERRCYALRGVGLEIARRVGWPVAEDKLLEDKPAQRLPYRGVVFDTLQCLLCIPEAKLQATERRCKDLLEAIGNPTVRQVRSLIGRVGWINQVMPLGRLHIHGLHAVIPRGAKNHWCVRLSAGALADLRWWLSFLRDASAGQSRLWSSFSRLQDMPVVRIFSDASGSEGFGGTVQGCVIAGTWTADAALRPGAPSIAWKELVPVYLLLREIAPSLAPGTLVVVTTDNEGNAFAVNNGDAAEGSRPVLRLICELAFAFRLRLLGDWVPRDFNVLPDLLSRLRPLPGSPWPSTRPLRPELPPVGSPGHPMSF